MADSSDSVGSWPGFIAQVNTTFNLVRDAFGYTLPGGAFLTIGIISGSYSLCRFSCLLWPYTLPAWAAFILGVAACYAAGNVMAAIIYMPFGVLKYIAWMIDRHFGSRDVANNTNAGIAIDPITLAPQQKRYVSEEHARNLVNGVVVTGHWFSRLFRGPQVTNNTNQPLNCAGDDPRARNPAGQRTSGTAATAGDFGNSFYRGKLA